MQLHKEHIIWLTEQTGDLYGRLEEGGTILETNEAWGRLLGFAPHMLVGCNWLSLLHAEDQEKGARFLRRPTSGSTEPSLLARMVSDTRQVYWVDWRCFVHPVTLSRFLVGRLTKPAYSSSSSYDLATPKVYPLLESVMEPFLVVERSGRILSGNQSACEALGYSSAELARLSMMDVTPELTAQRFRRVWQQLAPGQRLVLELSLRRQNGTEFAVEQHLVRGQEGTNFLLALCRDISEKKRQERYWRKLNDELKEARDWAIQANRTKNTFLANMSHELRTPLNAIIGYSEILQEELEERQEVLLSEDTQKIQKASRHLLSLINDLLDLAKIESGHLDLDEELFSVDELLGELADWMEPLFEKNNNRLHIELEPDLSHLNTDRGRLRQILLNLLSNANKFTKGGDVWVRGWRYHSGAESWAAIAIRDSGIGIKAEQLGKLFQPFTQADRSISSNYGGTGLGLALCQTMCRAMGGEIIVRSEPGVGSTFTIRLPEEVAGASIYTPSGTTPQTPSGPLGLLGTSEPSDARVLIVAADGRQVEFLSMMLEQQGVEVRHATTEREARAMANVYQPDALYLEQSMPGGGQILHALRDTAQLSRMPIVVGTKNDDLKFLLDEMLRVLRLSV